MNEHHAPRRNGRHDSLRSEFPDAAEYAFGTLSPDEHDLFPTAVSDRVDEQNDVSESLAVVLRLSEEHARSASLPRAAIRDRILAAATTTPRDIVRATDDIWQPMAPGIDIKLLSHDPATGVRTMIARLAQGAVYAAHRHVGEEQCLVLEGELVTDGTFLGPGDFIKTHHGTVHMDTHTDTGCLLLLTSQFFDEPLA